MPHTFGTYFAAKSVQTSFEDLQQTNNSQIYNNNQNNSLHSNRLYESTNSPGH